MMILLVALKEMEIVHKLVPVSKRTSGTGTCSDPSIGNVTCVSFGSGQNIGDAIFVRRAKWRKNLESFSHFHILNFGSQNSSDCASSGQNSYSHNG
jgi:hypothetical protein